MKALLTASFLCLGLAALRGQQLYMEAFGHASRTLYSNRYIPPDIRLSNKSDYLGFGGRIGFGADHLQVGAEYRSNLNDPTFKGGTDSYSFDETFYGGFVRTKISRYPAMRFGLVLRAGAGVYQTITTLQKNGSVFKQSYEPIFGLNGGFGFSIPTFPHTMLELGYTYSYLKRPGGIFIIPEHQASHHYISAGLSLNFVFGKRAKQYQHLRENWNFRNGWRQ